MFSAAVLAIYVGVWLMVGVILAINYVRKNREAPESVITPSDAGSALLHKALRHLVQACEKHQASCPYKEESLGPMITFSREVLNCDAATKGLERMASLEESSMSKNRDLMFYMALIITITKAAQADPKMDHLYQQIKDLIKDHCTCLVNICWLHNKGVF